MSYLVTSSSMQSSTSLASDWARVPNSLMKCSSTLRSLSPFLSFFDVFLHSMTSIPIVRASTIRSVAFLSNLIWPQSPDLRCWMKEWAQRQEQRMTLSTEADSYFLEQKFLYYTTGAAAPSPQKLKSMPESPFLPSSCCCRTSSKLSRLPKLMVGLASSELCSDEVSHELSEVTLFRLESLLLEPLRVWDASSEAYEPALTA